MTIQENANNASAQNDTVVSTQRVTVSLPQEAIDFLQREAAANNTSMANVLRRSIANEKFLKEARSSGAKLLLEQAGQPLTQLVFRD